MGIIIFLGVFLGNYLDEKFKTAPIITVILSLLSIAIALFNVFNQIKSIQKEKNNE